MDATLHLGEERPVQLEVLLGHVVERVVAVDDDEEDERAVLEHGAGVHDDSHQREHDDLNDKADTLRQHDEHGVEREHTHDGHRQLFRQFAQLKPPRSRKRPDVPRILRRALPEQRFRVEQTQRPVHLRAYPVAARVLVDVATAALPAAPAR